MIPSAFVSAGEKTFVATETEIAIERRERVLDEIFVRWRSGSVPDARAELEAHPELGRSRSVILELACEEFWQRTDRGEALAAGEFIDKFPGYASGLRRILALGSQLGAMASAHIERCDWPAIGAIYRGFRLQERLGCGAFSRVYLAQDTALADRRVVLKLTTLPGGEPEALGQLQHDHIVPVYAYYPPETDAFATLVMPYVGRATLEDLLDRIRSEPQVPDSARIIHGVVAESKQCESAMNDAPSPHALDEATFIDAVIRMAHGLCLGLAEAHERGLLHLDIKPSNVLLADDGTLKLLDFNLMQIVGKTDSTAWGGTLPYMSPEQLIAAVNAAEARLDARSDLYSLGVVLYELLTGRHPFEPLDPAEPPQVTADLLRERHQRGARPLGEFNPQVNKSCARLIETCLAYDPNDRPRDAREVAAALATELRSPAKMQRLRLRYPRGTPAVAAVMLLLCCAMAYGWSQYPAYNERCYVRAVTALREGRLADSVDLLTAGLEYDPTDERTRLLRAHCLAGSKRLDEAVAEYQALAGGPHAVEARSGLIYCCLKRNDPAGAFQAAAWEPSQNLTPADLNNLAYGHIQLGEHEAARALLDQAVELRPDSVVLRYHRATTDLNRARTIPGYLPSVGLSDLQYAVKLEPYEQLYYLLSQLHLAPDPNEPTARLAAEQALAEAVRCGLPPEEIRLNPNFKNLNIPVQQEDTGRSVERRYIERLIGPLQAGL